MNQDQLLALIETLLRNIANSKGAKLPPIALETRLLGGEVPIDSLDLASLVFELEQATGHDPFKGGFVNFQTVGELTKLYQR